ncbi:MAG: GGDEF domain-containing protein [Planctomycetota bacterium]|jgi:diguanylate cyclase (GGDEF)-like protein
MRLLLAEDDAFARRFLSRCITNWGYEVILAEDGEQAWQLLQAEDAPRLVLLDWMMPGLEGLEVCRLLRQRQEERSTYVIMLTASEETADLVSAMNAGADDFVTKSQDVRELEVRLRAARRIIELEDQLWRLATRDPMTKLWNHGAIITLLNRELAHAGRHEHGVGVVMADIDHFKSLNDTYGHKGGDAALVEVAERMAAELREYDSVGRYGGEEFLIVLPEPASMDVVVNAAERLRSCIADRPFEVEGNEVPITVSLGAAIGAGPGQLDAEGLIRAADEALYQARWPGQCPCR